MHALMVFAATRHYTRLEDVKNIQIENVKIIPTENIACIADIQQIDTLFCSPPSATYPLLLV